MPTFYVFGGAILPGGSYKVAYTAGTNEVLRFRFDNDSKSTGTWEKVATVSTIGVPEGKTAGYQA